MSNAVPNDWSIQPLEEAIAHLIDFRGRTPKKLGMEWGGGNIRALSANNVQMGKVDFGKECYLASEQLYEKWMTKGDVTKNDLLFTMEAPLGNVALVPDDRKYILSQRVILMKPKPDSVTSQFLFQQLRSDQFQRQLKENSTGSTAVGIQQKRLIQLELVLPPLPEQQKIGAILSSVDDVIEKIRAQVDKLKDLKNGMMQELWSKGVGAGGVPHTEFKESPVGRIPITWNVFPLEQLVRADRTITYGIVQAGPHYEAGVPYIRVSDMTRRHLSLDGMLRTSPEIAKKYKRSSVSPGDIVYALRGVIGHVHVVPPELDGANLTQGTARLSPNDSVHARYLLWAMKSPSVQLQNDLEAKGSTFKEVTLASLRKLQIAIPSVDEQAKIASIMDSIERKLHGSEDKLEHLQSLKKALMQDLLTGKVRVKVDQKESAVA